MEDIEFIKFLCKEILNICSDGDEPNLKVIDEELEKRGIDPNDIWVY